VEDLQDCERILKIAAAEGVGWHFQIDIWRIRYDH
jgi:hypothetical protein